MSQPHLSFVQDKYNWADHALAKAAATGRGGPSRKQDVAQKDGALEQEIASLQADKQKLLSRVEELMDAQRQLASPHANERVPGGSGDEQQLASLQEGNKRLLDRVKQLETAGEVLASLCTQLQKDKEGPNMQLVDAEVEHAERIRKMMEHVEELKKSSAEIPGLKTHNAQLRDELSEVNKKQTITKKRYESAKARAIELEKEIAKLKQSPGQGEAERSVRGIQFALWFKDESAKKLEAPRDHGASAGDDNHDADMEWIKMCRGEAAKAIDF